MRIYVTHKRDSNYINELYRPLKDSNIGRDNQLILPHDESQESYSSRDLFLNKKVDLVLAEVSNPATGQGIELGWADVAGLPIICFSKKDAKIANSLKSITDKFIVYTDSIDMIEKLNTEIQKK
ncbi:MAG: hypothetical protein WCG48_02330 [Candidatus Berkelbacteria bacterium]